uniref:Uncharacterized protein n=1 Tax=Ditylenchus dipsaci TaxID=166011 RepID=A0A915E2E0_9BILA
MGKLLDSSITHYLLLFTNELKICLRIPAWSIKAAEGVAVDEQGFVVVADSGNNRVQVFSPDGQSVRVFGAWGILPGQLKGVEGVAIVDTQIIVSDRENHRVQLF